MDTDIQGSSPDIEKLTRVYIKIRDKRSENKKAFEEEDVRLEEQQRKIKHTLLEHCAKNNIDSLRTPQGLIYRSVKRNYWTNDWESMYGFIKEHGAPELLEKRIQQTNMKQFLEENPDLLPPGLNVDSEYVLTIRRK